MLIRRGNINKLFKIFAFLSLFVLVFAFLLVGITACDKEDEKTKVINVGIEIIDSNTTQVIEDKTTTKVVIKYDENFKGLSLKFRNLATGKYLTDKDVAPKNLNDLVEISYNTPNSETIGGNYAFWPKNKGYYYVTVSFNVAFWTNEPFEYKSSFDDRFNSPSRSFVLEIV